MSEQKNPKLEFQTNVVQKFTFNKMFKDGETKGNKWYGVSCNVDGVEHVFFAYDALWNKLKTVKQGDVCEVIKAETKNEQNKTIKEWRVRINGEAQGAGKTKEIADTAEKQEQVQEVKGEERQYWLDKEQRKAEQIHWEVCLKCAVEIAKEYLRVNPESEYDTKQDITDYANFLYNLKPAKEEEGL